METTDAVEEYDIKSNYWRSLPNLKYSRANPIVVSISDYIYVFCGFDTSKDSDIEINYNNIRKFERYKIGAKEWEEIELSPLLQSFFSLSSAFPIMLRNQNDPTHDKMLIFGGFENRKMFGCAHIRLIDVKYLTDIIKHWNHEKTTTIPNLNPFVGYEDYIKTDPILASQSIDPESFDDILPKLYYKSKLSDLSMNEAVIYNNKVYVLGRNSIHEISYSNGKLNFTSASVKFLADLINPLTIYFSW